MYVAIDDTYSSNVTIDSKYVTDRRRTNVAVCFPDDDVEYVRSQAQECLQELNASFKVNAKEFHFVEIVNRKGDWHSLNNESVSNILRFFVSIYNHHKWQVHIQTVDDRTFADHGVIFATDLHGLDPVKREDQCLFLLMLKLRRALKNEHTITLILDEGRAKAGTPFGSKFFPEWKSRFQGYFEDSKKDPILQIADFVAYSINRLTNLATKPQRTITENEQISILGKLSLNCHDVRVVALRKNFGRAEFDAFHHSDRKRKGLEP